MSRYHVYTLHYLHKVITSYELKQISLVTILDDNGIVLLVLATFGTISLLGACAFCFRKKKTFEVIILAY